MAAAVAAVVADTIPTDMVEMEEMARLLFPTRKYLLAERRGQGPLLACLVAEAEAGQRRKGMEGTVALDQVQTEKQPPEVQILNQAVEEPGMLVAV